MGKSSALTPLRSFRPAIRRRHAVDLTKWPEGHPTVLASKGKINPGDTPVCYVKASLAAETDIHNIIKKYRQTGTFTHVNRRQPVQGDFFNVKGYDEALQTVINAQDMFSQLPAAVRDRFQNDPSELLTFLQDPKNLDEAEKIGLVTVTRKDSPPKSPKVPPAEPSPADKEKAKPS